MRYLRTYIRILKQIKTRPTRYFPLLVLAIIALFLLAYMHNYNIVYLMMFFTFALAGASSLIGRFNLIDLELAFFSGERCFAKVQSHYAIRLSNPALSRSAYAVELHTGDEHHVVNILPPYADQIVRFDLTPLKRGTITLPAIELGSRFPLPHELLYREIDLRRTLTVYPEPKGMPLEAFTNKSRTFSGEQDDFDGIRNYRKGDPLSLIHWASIAKNSELMSKEFIYNEQNRKLYFDFRLCGDDDEARLSQLTLWILECERKAIPYLVKMPDQMIDSMKVPTDAILETLARF